MFNYYTYEKLMNKKQEEEYGRFRDEIDKVKRKGEVKVFLHILS
jgi:hypothetical protein